MQQDAMSAGTGDAGAVQNSQAPHMWRAKFRSMADIEGELTAESAALQQVGNDSNVGEQQPERCDRKCLRSNGKQAQSDATA